MSNRPVCLKYLKPKMKIILCIFLLYITAVSVFGESQELDGIEGKSIVFEHAVKTNGGLMYRDDIIGDVRDSILKPHTGRVHWDSSTGYFSLSGLRLNDSGVYNVQNDGQKSVSFNLTVWKGDVTVSKPSVTFISKEYPCTLSCTVERGTQGTLFWYRDSEKNPQGGSHFAIAPHRNQIQAMLGSRIYTCEANNSVSNNKTSVYLEDHCRAGAAGIWQTEGSKMWSLCLVLIVMLCSRLV